jgi:tRNA (guanine-N7-)-methyltransferase
MSKPNSPFMRRIRSFVKREGRLTPGQARALEKSWPIHGRDVSMGPLPQAKNAVLEIGFGNGSSLLEMALAAPARQFIGIEVHRPGVGALLIGMAENQIENLLVYQEDAIEVLTHCVPDASLARLQLYFPDPWPKKKHHKRRIVQPDFAALVLQKLQPGGVFHLATDWENYAEHMQVVMDAAPGFENMAGAGQYSPKPNYRPTTKFEQRGQRLGHGVWDLLYCKSALATF